MAMLPGIARSLSERIDLNLAPLRSAFAIGRRQAQRAGATAAQNNVLGIGRPQIPFTSPNGAALSGTGYVLRTAPLGLIHVH